MTQSEEMDMCLMLRVAQMAGHPTPRRYSMLGASSIAPRIAAASSAAVARQSGGALSERRGKSIVQVLVNHKMGILHQRVQP
mmetsp:Transcript_103771/g.203502  ORF Transcript_103771/g.203502 Transcript_103771/m.203502 type:complete len:82 (+) Transcript_103771:19-264(+)